jgi:hypothetical protein
MIEKLELVVHILYKSWVALLLGTHRLAISLINKELPY